MKFVKFASRVVSKMKGSEFVFSDSISNGYLISILISRVGMLIRGNLRFGPFKFVYVGSNVTLKTKSKMRFGKNLTISQYAYVDANSIEGIVLGDNVSIGRYTSIECSGTLRNIGKGFFASNNVGLGTHCFFGSAGGIYIGNDTIFGNYVSVHSENHNIDSVEVPIRLQGVNRKGVVIGDDCWIGAKVTILDGVQIEDGCIIGAGSVLTCGVYKSRGIYAGVPAKLIRYRVDK